MMARGLALAVGAAAVAIGLAAAVYGADAGPATADAPLPVGPRTTLATERRASRRARPGSPPRPFAFPLAPPFARAIRSISSARAFASGSFPFRRRAVPTPQSGTLRG